MLFIMVTQKLKKSINHINVENVGTNFILKFQLIIMKVFQNNCLLKIIFYKHLKKDRFIKLINRKVFTNLEDNDQERFPIYIGSNTAIIINQYIGINIIILDYIFLF